MQSIRNKLFLQIGALIIVLIGLLLLVNTLFLNKYYTSQKKSELIDYYNSIDAIATEDYVESLTEFINIESTSNIDILIKDEEEGIIYTSNGYMVDERFKPKYLDPMAPIYKEPLPDPVKNKEEMINDKIRFIWVEDDFNATQSILLEGALSNGNSIRMRLPLASINASVKIVNQFLLVLGGFIFLLAMGVAYFLSKSFTEPILEMNKVTLRLKQLDFNEGCKIKTKDELGQLADNINEMASELKVTMDTLSQKNIQLEKEIDLKESINEKRRMLLENVAHELKTPLALMQGYAEGLTLNIVKDKVRSDFYCSVIVDEAQKMDKLVQNLLSINQIELGDDPLQKSEFDLLELTEYVYKKYQPIFEEEGIESELIMVDTARVYADAFRSEQVLTNYINNAIQYTDENKGLKITIEEKEAHFRVNIFNTTTPIDDIELERIWDSFYKVDRARTREKGGHGLGLSIVRAIQNLDNNGYGVYNIENGICFWFELDKANPV